MDLGKIAYEAYIEYRCGDDNLLRSTLSDTWDRLSADVQDAWRVVATSVRDASPWIPVGERMPEEDEVIVYDAKAKWVGSAGVEINKFMNVRDWDHMPDVTHWMPLPEAPQ